MSAGVILTRLYGLALHVRLAVGGLGEGERLAEDRLVFDVPHQGTACVCRRALAH